MNELRENRERGKMIDELIEKAWNEHQNRWEFSPEVQAYSRAVAEAAYGAGLAKRENDFAAGGEAGKWIGEQRGRREFARELLAEYESVPVFEDSARDLVIKRLREQAGEEA